MHTAGSSHRPVGVAIRSPRRLYRDVLAVWLAAQPGFTVVGHVAGTADLRELCALRAPELVLFDAGSGGDASLDELGELGGLSELRTGSGRSRVVLVYDQLSPAALAAVGRVGVERVVPCSYGLDALLAVLHEYAYQLRGRPPGGAPSAGLTNHLTDREREVLTLVASGHPVERIAELLHTSAYTVEHRKRRLYAKLQAVNQSHAIARAVALGIVDRPARPPAAGPAGNGLPDLTTRETQILRSIAAGDTVRQTARALGITMKTVENTQTRLFRKLGGRNRAATLARALDLGLVPDPPRARPAGTRR